jgi:ABC-type branched-subunit amino acid transport system substrate-binding protein
LENAGNRAGRYRLQLLQDSNLRGPLSVSFSPPLSMDLGDSNLAIATFLVQNRRTGNLEKFAELRVLPDLKELGRAAAAWSRETRPGRVTLLSEKAIGEEEPIAVAFQNAAGDLPLSVVHPFLWTEQELPALDRVLAEKPDLVFYTGEKAPYGSAFDLFDALRKRGYRGLLAMADSDPEVSYLAVPTKVVEGTLLVSTIGPPSQEFAAAYEPATGRHAGPHAWPGYLLMKAVIELIERADSNDGESLYAALMARPAPLRSCALYQFKEGKFVFVQDLK